jgi:hypothetical protein
MSKFSMLQSRVMILAAIVAFASLSPVSHAQGAGLPARLNVPFAFETGNHRYAAGIYSMQTDEIEHVLIIKGVSDSGIVMTAAEDTGRIPTKGVAVFHKYGERYFLSSISLPGSSRRVRVHQAKAESKMQIGRNQSFPENIELAVLTQP